MNAEVVWFGWLALFLLYEVTAAVRERGKPDALTLSRNVWAWFGVRPGGSPWRRLVLAVFLLTLTAHLVLAWPGGLAVIATGTPVLVIIAVGVCRRGPGAVALLLALPALVGADRCGVPWPPWPGPTPTPAPTAEPTPAPTPAPLCSIDGEPGPPLPGYKNQHGEAVNAAMHRLRPDCEVGGDCLLQVGRQEWQAQVVAALREAGLCAGQHAPDTDEIAVATSTTAPREGWHVFAGGDGVRLEPGLSGARVVVGKARRTVVWAPQAARGAYAAPDVAPPGPTPTPAPTATPAPTPAADGCGAPAPPPAYRIALKHHTAFCANLDSTVQVRGAEYCAAIGFTDGRSVCPVRQEGAPDRAACERRIAGRQRWQCQGACDVYPCAEPGNCVCGTTVNTNPAQAIVIGSGRVTTCTEDGAVCGAVVVP